MTWWLINYCVNEVVDELKALCSNDAYVYLIFTKEKYTALKNRYFHLQIGMLILHKSDVMWTWTGGN